MGSLIRITVLAIFTLMASGCDENTVQSDPAVYNDSIVAAFSPVQKVYSEMVEGIYAAPHEELDALLSEFQNASNSLIRYLDKLPGFENDTSLRHAAMELGRFYYQASHEEYSE